MASQSWGEMEERQQSGGKVNWVDIDDDEGAYEADTYLPPPEVTEDEKTGTKTVVEYRIENGKKVKVTSKYKIVNKTKKVSKGVAERSQWKKFGSSDKDAQTIVSKDEIRIEDPKEGDEAEKRAHEEQLRRVAIKLEEGKQRRAMEAKLGLGDSTASRKGGLYDPSLADKMRGEDSVGGAPGKYVPPSMRGGAAGQKEERDESNTLRVNNISEDANERDLYELFNRFGYVQRIFLARDRENQRNRGFAYVTYGRREDALAAMSALDGFGYDHLILKVEMAAEKAKDDVGSQNLIGKYASGYGKALPQG